MKRKRDFNYIEQKIKLNGDAKLLDWCALQKDKKIARQITKRFDEFWSNIESVYDSKTNDNIVINLNGNAQQFEKTKQGFEDVYKFYLEKKEGFFNNSTHTNTYELMHAHLILKEPLVDYVDMLDLFSSNFN